MFKGTTQMKDNIGNKSVIAGEDVVFILLAGLLFGYEAHFIIHSSVSRLLAGMPDDAAYFFKIAENAAIGKGISFDGLHETNGFQPLWLLILIPIYKMYDGPPEMMCRVILSLQLFMNAVSAAIVYHTLSKVYAKSVCLISGTFFIFLVSLKAVNGMESSILILLASIVFAYGLKTNLLFNHRDRATFLFGILVGLVALSRLDMVFGAVAILLVATEAYIANGERRKCIMRESILGSFGFLLVTVPYLAFNVYKFGHIVPVSGQLKSDFTAIKFTSAILPALHPEHYVAIILALGYLGYHGFESARNDFARERTYLRKCLLVMSVTLLLCLLYSAFVMKWAIFEYHFIFYSFFACAVIAEFLTIFLSLMPTSTSFVHRSRYVFAMLIFIAGSIVLYRFQHRPLDRVWEVASYTAATWVRDNVGRGEVLAMKDCGDFGYFSQRSVINLDGVVNNFDFQDTLRNRRLNEYFSKYRVRYLAQHAFWGESEVNQGEYENYPLSYWSHLYHIASDSIIVNRVNEVYRSQPYFDGPYRTVFIIWKLKDD